MGTIIELREDDWNGLCPNCRRPGLNMHENYKSHWSVCREHKLKWWTGYGLFSFPFTDDDGEWSRENGDKELQRNRYILKTYHTVKPFFWPREPQVAAGRS